MTSNDMKSGALYIRVSTHDQDELSPDAQIRLCLDYAKSNNILVTKEHIFMESISGRKAKNRREFQKMIALAKSPDHPFDAIIVWKFSRFARNQEESIVYKSMLKKDNIEVISVSEPLIDGPFGSLIERIIEWMDEYYSIRLSGEVLRGMGEKALKQGYQISPPLGYAAVGNGEPYIIDEKEFEIVSYIFEQFDKYDRDPTKIARNLNAMGRRSKRGTLFEPRTINRILKNPFYYGEVIWKDTSFMGTHEVRLTKEQFDKRMEKIQKRYKPDKRHNISSCNHWLSGILKCAKCGASLAYNGKHNRVPGFQCWRYSKGFHKESCFISERKVLDAVYTYFEDILAGEEFQYRMKTPQKDSHDEEISALKRELEKIATRESRIRLAFEDGIDTLEEYKENKKRLISQKNSLLEEIAKLESFTPEEPSKEYALDKIESVYNIIKSPATDYETKGTAIRSLLESIIFDREAGEFRFILYIS